MSDIENVDDPSLAVQPGIVGRAATRPPPDDQGLTEKFFFRVNPAWMADIKACAKHVGLSVAGFARMAMEKEMQETRRHMPREADNKKGK